jgi:hypothetical protein
MNTKFCEILASEKLAAHAAKNSPTSEFARLLIQEAELRHRNGYGTPYECAVSDGMEGEVYAGPGKGLAMREFSRQCMAAFTRPLTEKEIATKAAADAVKVTELAEIAAANAAYKKAVESAQLAVTLSADVQNALVEIVGSQSHIRNNSVDNYQAPNGSVKILRTQEDGYDAAMDNGRGNSGRFKIHRWVEWVPAREITPADIEQAERQASGVEVVNLTPHPLTIERTDGTVAAIAATGAVARLTVTRDSKTAVKTTVGEFVVSAPKFGAIEGLPEPQNGKIYVVSAMVAEAAKRPDVFSPGELLRDAEGKIIGARGLCVYA